jgi:hypothetical protein
MVKRVQGRKRDDIINDHLANKEEKYKCVYVFLK